MNYAEDGLQSNEKVLINQHDAEIKILETVSRIKAFYNLPKGDGIKTGLEINVFSDRQTCEYCQEVNFRANRIGQSVFFRISPYDTPIDSTVMRGAPLFIGERIRSGEESKTEEQAPDDVKHILKFLDLIDQGVNICAAKGYPTR